jgi:hypothetical protein
LKVIIILVQIGTMEIYVAIVEAFKEKGKKGSFHPLSPLSMVLT